MNRLYVFDMDGTLLPGTTALLEIAKLTGHEKELLALEKLYVESKIDNATFSQTVFQLWKTLTPETIQEAFLNAPKINRIKEVLQAISDQGNISCLITASQDFFAHYFYEYGFDFIFASKGFCLKKQELNNERVLQSKHKLLIAEQLCERFDIPLEETVAFGDSISDVHLFKNIIHSISINGDHHIEELASHHYRGTDLMEAFNIVTSSFEEVSMLKY